MSRRTASASVMAGMALLLVATAVGAWVAVAALRSPGRPPALALADPDAPDLALGRRVRTSFGSVVVSEAESNNGLSGRDLGGMSHGVSSLVGSGSAQVSVVVTLTNDSTRTVPTSATQFRLLTRRPGSPSGRPVRPQGTTLQVGRLVPGSAVDARVTFVTATDGSQMWLQYTDPAGRNPIRIALGRAAGAGASAPAHHG